MTKAAFITAYRNYVLAQNLPWLQEKPAQLDALIADVERTLEGPACTWVWDGPGAKAAWKAIGGKGRMTLTALRALPA